MQSRVLRVVDGELTYARNGVQQEVTPRQEQYVDQYILPCSLAATCSVQAAAMHDHACHLWTRHDTIA